MHLSNSEVQVQLPVGFSSAVNHRNGALEVQLNGVKRSSSCAMIGPSTFSVSVFYGLLVVDIIMFDASRNAIISCWVLKFSVLEFSVCLDSKVN